MAGQVTVYDIAEAAQTSVSTVSRVLNGSSLVGKQTRDHVLAVASSLGYTARQIRRPGGRSVLNVVVFLPNKAQPEYHLFYDAALLLSGVYAGLGQTRAHTIMALNHSQSPFSDKKLGDIDGCIFAFCEPDEQTTAELADREIPAVLVNRSSNHHAGVVNDPLAGYRELARWFSRSRPGARPLYVATQEQQPVADQRLDALRAAASGIWPELAHVRVAAVAELTSELLSRYVSDGRDCIICVNDLVAVAVCERLLRAGYDVPSQVVVTGYDNAPVRSLLETPVPTIDLAVDTLASRAAERLVEAILAREPLSGTEYLPGTLVTVGSGKEEAWV